MTKQTAALQTYTIPADITDQHVASLGRNNLAEKTGDGMYWPGSILEK